MMASPASYLSEKEEHHDDIDSQELFDSFMEITKHQEGLQSEANGTLGTENHQNEANGISATEHLESETNGMSENVTAVNADVDKNNESTVTDMQSGTDMNDESQKDSNNSNVIQKEEEQNMTKRLSKAVDELSDLEKQLSLMISTGSCSTPTDLGNNKDDASETGQREKVAIWGDEQGNESKADTSENEHNKHEKGAISSCEEGDSNSPNEISDDVFEAANDVSEKELEKSNPSENGNAPSEVLPKSETTDSESAMAQTDNNVVNSEKDDGTKERQVENDSMRDDIETTTKNEEDVAEVHETEDLDNTVLEKSIEESEKTLSSTLVDDNQNSTENEDGVPANEISSTNDVPSGEAASVTVQTDENPSSSIDPSTPEIAILMTDESGISERKSLDSLDAECEMRPDSPALSDEGIDSDARSMDGLDDDDDDDDTPFDSDPSIKDCHLQVDRNRFGSNSSTISEREFRNSGIAKDDGDDQAKIQIKGYLMKLGGSGFTPRNWRKRWFVLKEDNCLYYYKNSKDKTPCGVIVLFNYSVTKAPDSNKKYCFKLNKGGARTYHFCAGNDDDMRQWMISLMKAASAVSDTGTSFQILEGNVHNVSIPALSIKDPECHGYLSKQGQGIKSWKRRYCVLKNGYLYYYSDMSNTTALGVARLLGYQIKNGESRGKYFSFYASPPDESMRVYHFAAETENDRERWMNRMEESIIRGNTST